MAAGQEMERSLVAVIPGVQNGRYKMGICLVNSFGPSFNSAFREIKVYR